MIWIKPISSHRINRIHYQDFLKFFFNIFSEYCKILATCGFSFKLYGAQSNNKKFYLTFRYRKPRANSDKLINELRVNILTSCVYCVSYELRVSFIAWVTSFFLHASYELLFIALVTSYFLYTSYKLLLIPGVTINRALIKLTTFFNQKLRRLT